MRRFVVALVSAVIAVLVVIPYGILLDRGHFPAFQPGAAQPGRAGNLFAAKCSVLFYAVFYFVAKTIFAAVGMHKDLREVSESSRGHMHLLHVLAGTFMITAPWLDRAWANRNAGDWLSMIIGFAWICYEVYQIRRERRLRRAMSGLQSDGSVLQEPATPFRFYFTHIAPFGVNLLGILNFFGFIGGLALMLLLPDQMAAVERFLMAALTFACIIVDVAWRLRLNSGSRIMRLLSPHAGGTVVFIPIWAAYILLTGTTVIAILLGH